MHAAGEFVGAYVGLVVEAEQGEQFGRALGGRLPTDAVVSRVVDQDLPDGQNRSTLISCAARPSSLWA
ncbi:hypothetical protein ADL28_31515 [Streptomyces violaceusniger]|uniref:Uncharacterized protein n=1 Tax=Streptomyces violaceusniger TaxID=68280 RepID=A0A0X3VTQ0_STRVO|nr:hypothetical protein ADL28_31515 [Streptomyces violaceusniger]